MAVPCSAMNVFVAGTVANPALVNQNFSNLVSCAENIDATNIGTSGIFASQIIPTTTAQATFGGTQSFLFPYGISAGATTLLNGLLTSGGFNQINLVASSGAVLVDYGAGTSNGVTIYNGTTSALGPLTASTGSFSGVVTDRSAYLTPVFGANGNAIAQPNMHSVLGNCTMSGSSSCSLSFSGSAQFYNASTYSCAVSNSNGTLAPYALTSSGTGMVVETASANSYTYNIFCTGY